ncbi:MAG: penicillin-binding protein 2 [Victivallaceae bacterium]|nr:penicillin-binding protein 2 [Victivallaceae bacterium]
MLPKPADPTRKIRLRTGFVVGVLCVFALALAGRFFYIQVMRHEYYLDKAKKKYTSSMRTFGRRGEIFDCHGELLVGNQPCMEISASPCNIRDDALRRKVAQCCAAHLNRDEEYFYKKLAPHVIRKDENGRDVEKPNTYQMLGRFTPYEIGEKLQKELRALGINANTVSFRDSSRRTYPKGRMLSNWLGYTNIVEDSDVAQSGIEKSLDQAISQQTGRRVYIHARDGAPLTDGLLDNQESRDGKNIYLTIDEPIQAILEEELDAAMIEFSPKIIYAAIADPATGKILAIAQRPTFDPNDRKTFRPEATQNHIAEDYYEPGSVVKPFTVGKALDWGVVTPETKVDCEKGRWIYRKRPLTDSHDVGLVTVGEVIAQSSNIGTAKIALQIGSKQRIYQIMRIFGGGQKTDLPIAHQSAGNLRPPHLWDGQMITRVPIGYSVGWTALQLLRAYCGLANPLGMPHLRLIDRYEDPLTGETTEPEEKPFRRVFQHDSARTALLEMMIGVTRKGGTATRAAIPGYTVAGKTGTSNKVDPETHRYSNKLMCSFIGIVPAHDPKLVMIVSLDSPDPKFRSGGRVSAPIFARTMKRVLQYLNVPPDEPVPEK